MIIGILTLAILYAIYLLLIRGWLWKLILLVMGWVGIDYVLLNYVSGSHNTAIVFSGYSISWAAAIASGVCLMALLTTESK